ncbi:MAG: deoxynucleoside kinase, partial [Chitinophagaceae bacterium]
LQDNIKKRNRSYEQKIPDAYLLSIQETYTNYIRQQNIKTLFVDATHGDFLSNDHHLRIITDALEKNYSEGQHYISLP